MLLSGFKRHNKERLFHDYGFYCIDVPSWRCGFQLKAARSRIECGPGNVLAEWLVRPRLNLAS